MASLLKRLIAKALLRWSARKFYERTRAWGRARWIRYVKESFEKIKTKWTLRNFPWLKEATIEDLRDAKVHRWIPPPNDYPFEYKIYSSGTTERKEVKVNREDLKTTAKWIGWIILNNLGRFPRNFLGIYASGQLSEVLTKFVAEIFADRSTLIQATRLVESIEAIEAGALYDVSFLLTPFLPILLKNITKDIFEVDAILGVGGTLLTSDIIKLVEDLNKKKGLRMNLSNIYGLTETGILAYGSFKYGMRGDMAYLPTHVGFIRTEEGKLINIFDAPKGTKGEYIITRFSPYAIPNYNTDDIVEVVKEDSPHGLPTIRIIGRGARVKMEINIPDIGEVRAWGLWFLRLPTISINSILYSEFRGEGINALFVVEDKGTKAILWVYVSEKVTSEKFELLIRRFDPILLELINHGIVEPRVIHNKKFVDGYYKKGIMERPQSGYPPILLISNGGS